MSYSSCPACSSAKSSPFSIDGRKLVSVVQCGACEAVYGDCYLGDSYAIVRPHFAADEVDAERLRYYDFTTLGSAGVSRRHGWYDPATRLIHQVG